MLNKKLLFLVTVLGLSVQSHYAQTVIDFDPQIDITGQAIKSISVEGFTFAATIANPIYNIGFDEVGVGGSFALIDGNLEEFGLTRWTITRDGGTEFQFRSIFINRRDNIGSSSGFITGFKNGTPTGSAKPIIFSGVQSFANDPDFYDVDEIRIEAPDIYVAIDDFTYGSVFTEPVNAAPTDITLSPTSINENVAANSTVGSFTTTDPDAGNTFTYTLVAGSGDTDNASFNISGANLRITNSPNFEVKNSYSVRIRTTDQGGLSFEKAFTITINDVNEAPTDITLSPTSINENVPANSTVGTLSTTDPDAGNTFTYTLVAGTGSTDNGSFTISGANLIITNSPNFEVKNSYSVRIRTTDQGGLFYEEAFTITINDVNEAPTDITLSSTDINENVPANSTVGTLSTTDPDAGNTFTYTLVAGTGDADNTSFSISGADLIITNSPNFDVKNSYSVRIRTTDQGGLFYEEAFTITINNVNEAPMVTVPLTIAAFEDEPQALTGISFSDVDAGSNSVTATFSVGSGTLSATNGGGVSVGGTASDRTLSGAINDINTFISAGNLTFTTALNSTSDVTLTININDNGNSGTGGALTDAANVIIDVTAVNDAPVNSVPGNQVTSKDVTVVFSAGNGNLISVSDVDAGGAAIRISLTATNGVLSLSSSTGLAFTTGTGVNNSSMNFTGTISAINNAMSGMTFNPAQGYNGPATLTIMSDDQGFSGSGGAQTDTDIIDISVNSTNPIVASVTSSSANGLYKVGDEIVIQVIFDQPVEVNTAGGTPSLTLETGVVDRASTYVGGSGTTTLNFSYTVQAGDASNDLDYATVNSLILDGAVIENSTNNIAILGLPTPGSSNSLSGQKDIGIDGVVPMISSVSVPANGVYSIDQSLNFTVNFSEAVVVNGSPQLSLTVGSTNVQANYSSGSGTSALVFTYNVQSGALDLNGIVVGTLSLNSGTVRDAVGNDANLTINSVGSTSQVLVDGERPIVVSLSLSDNSLAIGQTAILTVAFSERISGLEISDFTVANGTLSGLTSADGGETWTATFTPTSNVQDATNVISLDNEGYTDLAGNEGTGTTESFNYEIDTQRPSATIVVADSQLTIGETGLVTITFTEAVTGLMLDDFSVGNGILSDLESADGGISWTATLTPDLGVENQNNLITLDNTGYQDLSGNTGSGTTQSNIYSVDTGIPNGYSVSVVPNRINGVNQNNFSFNLIDGELGSDYSFSVISSAGGTPVTGTGEVTSDNQLVDGVNVSSLPDGTLTLTVTLTDPSGNEGDGASDTVEKILSAQLTIRLVQNGEEGGLDGAFEIVTDNTFATATDVTLQIGGSATPGTDYLVINNITFPTNTISLLIPLEVIDDLDVEGEETVSIRLLATNNTLVTIGEPNQATLTIADNDVQKQLTITPIPNQQKVYGDSDPMTFSYAASGFNSGDDSSIIQGALSRQAGDDAGAYSYSLGNLDAGPNYELVLNLEVFTISPATLTIEVDDLQKVYGDENPDYTYVATGLKLTDTQAILTGALGRAGGENVGTYQFNLGTLSAGANYSLQLISTTPFLISPAPLRLIADNKQKIFGVANPALTFIYDGLVNGDTQIQNVPTLSTTATAISPVGNYPITVTGGFDPNYSISRVEGTLTIGRKTVTITASNQSKVYGQANPVLTFSYTDLLEGDTQIQNEPSISTEATISSPVGTYDITLTGGSDPNYDFTLVNGTLSVTPANLTIRADDKSKVYGEVNPLLTFNYNGLVNGDSGVAIEPNITTTATVSSNVGTYPITLTGSSDPNYAITLINGTLTVTPADLTITADDKSKVFGEANPVLTFNYDGLVNGDTQIANEPSIATIATVSSNVGTYPITLSGGSDPNYAITRVNGTLTIGRKTVTGITFEDQSFVFDGATKSLSISGSLPDGTSVAYENNSRTNVGTQEVTATISGSNFTSLVLRADLTITPATITGITFDDGTFVFDGTEKSLVITGNLPSGALVVYDNNDQTNAGIYAVVATVRAENFMDLVLSADLTITKASQVISFAPIADKSQRTDVSFELGATTTSGLPLTYSFTFQALNPPVSIDPSGRVTILGAGDVTITATQSGNQNFEAAQSVSQTFRVIGSQAQVNAIVVNGTVYSDPAATIYYVIDCGGNENEVRVEIENIESSTINRDQVFTVNTPAPGIFRETVTVTSEDGLSSRAYTIVIEKRFNFDDIVVQKFNNVLLINNNPVTNGGYRFVRYRWFKNGTLIGNEQYYSAGDDREDQLDPGSTYFAQLETEDGEFLRTCSFEIELQRSSNLVLTPNPVPLGGTIVLFADYSKEELATMQISIYTLNGIVLKTIRSTEKTTRIELPSTIQKGVHLLRVQTMNSTKTLKFIVL